MRHPASTYLKRTARQGGIFNPERDHFLGQIATDTIDWPNAIREILIRQRPDGGFAGEKPASAEDDGSTTAPGLTMCAALEHELIPEDMAPRTLEAIRAAAEFILRSQHASGLFVQAATFNDTYEVDGIPFFEWDRPPFSRHADAYRFHPGHNDRRTADCCEFLEAASYTLPTPGFDDRAHRAIERAAQTTIRLFDEHGGLFDDYDGLTYRPSGSPAMLPRRARPHETDDYSPNAVGWGGETVLMWADHPKTTPKESSRALRVARTMGEWLERALLKPTADPSTQGLWPLRVEPNKRTPIFTKANGMRTSDANDPGAVYNYPTKNPRAFLQALERIG